MFTALMMRKILLTKNEMRVTQLWMEGAVYEDILGECIVEKLSKSRGEIGILRMLLWRSLEHFSQVQPSYSSPAVRS